MKSAITGVFLSGAIALVLGVGAPAFAQDNRNHNAATVTNQDTANGNASNDQRIGARNSASQDMVDHNRGDQRIGYRGNNEHYGLGYHRTGFHGWQHRQRYCFWHYHHRECRWRWY